MFNDGDWYIIVRAKVYAIYYCSLENFSTGLFSNIQKKKKKNQTNFILSV